MAGWLTPVVRNALPLALAEATAMLAPAVGADFKASVLPALVLVAPSGWSEGQSAAWQAAAAQELSGIPADLLAVGAAAARKVADHPSKIIPAIHATIGKAWAARRADLAKLRTIDDVASGRRTRKPWEPEPFDPATLAKPEEVAELVSGFGIGGKAQPAREPARMPTDADYAAMGVTAKQLAASRAAAAEDAARPRSEAPQPMAETGPTIQAGDDCPHCGANGATVGGGFAFCDHPNGCGRVWQMVAQAA